LFSALGERPSALGDIVVDLIDINDGAALVKKHGLRKPSYSKDAAAEEIGSSRKHVDRLIERGDLIATRVSVDPDKPVRTQKIIIRAVNLARFLEQRERVQWHAAMVASVRLQLPRFAAMSALVVCNRAPRVSAIAAASWRGNRFQRTRSHYSRPEPIPRPRSSSAIQEGVN